MRNRIEMKVKIAQVDKVDKVSAMSGRFTLQCSIETFFFSIVLFRVSLLSPILMVGKVNKYINGNLYEIGNVVDVIGYFQLLPARPSYNFNT